MIQHDPTVDRFLMFSPETYQLQLGKTRTCACLCRIYIQLHLYKGKKQLSILWPGDAVAVHVECLQVVEPSTNGQL